MKSGVMGRVERVIKVLSDMRISAHSYIDLGGGDGKYTSRIATIVGAEEVCCVDISDRCLNQLPSWIEGVKFNLNSEDFPFQDEYFDLVSALEVIEHLVKCDNLVKNSYRLLKKGGHFIISTPNLSSWINRILLLLGYQPIHTEPSREFIVGSLRGVREKKQYHGHMKLLTFRALKELLLVNGFRVKKCVGASISVDGFRAKKGVPSTRLLTYIDSRITSIFPSLAEDIIILAEKR